MIRLAIYIGCSISFSANAQIRNNLNFSFNQQTPLSEFDNNYWQYDFLPAGISANFSLWGSPDPAAGCKTNINGILVNGLKKGPMVIPPWPLPIESDTGLPLTNSNQLWIPSSDARCSSQNWMGFSHVHINNSGQANGIGLYTHSGPKPTDSSASFFQAYSASGDPFSGGANANIQGSIISFRNSNFSDASSKPLTTFPFSSQQTNDANVLRLAVRSIQGLKTWNATIASPQASGFQQNFGITAKS